MDIFFHALTGFAFKWKSQYWQAALFSVLPDIIGMGGFFGWQIYNFAHSVSGIVVAFIIILLFTLPYELIIFYIFHEVIDWFTHGSGTSNILYPIYQDPIHVLGINWWQNLWIELLPYILIISLIFYRYKLGNYNNDYPFTKF